MEIINLNLIPGKAWPVCHASQFDAGREIRVNLFEGAGVYTLAGDEVVDVIVKKPDGNEVIETLTNTADDYVVIVTTEQMTAIAGSNLGEIRITKGAQVIGSLNFILECEASPDTGIESHSEINNLETQVAAIVADQYDAADVVFDAAPTAGHGVGFAVTSEGVKDADDAVKALIPDELDDLGDVDISGAAIGEALVWDGTKWVNGTVSTVGSIDDLNDVDTTGKAEGDSLRYDSGSGEWVAKPIVIEVTQAEYDQLVLDGDLQPLTTYVITDAPNLNATAQNLSYDGGVTSTYDEVESVKTTLSGQTDATAPLFKVVYFGNSESISFTADGVVSLTANQLNISTPTGYTPISVVSIFANNNDVFYRSWNASATGTQSFCVAHKIGAAASIIFNCAILYAKTSYVKVIT